jgi:probable HAF family extracellular repeat protein
MKTVLFRISLVGTIAAAGFHAQGLRSLDGSASTNSAAPPPARYSVASLGTLGGTFSVAFGVNNAGRIGGAAALPNGDTHAFLSDVGTTKYDFGTLGGPNSQASTPNGMENVTILSETSKPDPLGEDFCAFGDHLICLGALWNGKTTLLPTLGGNNAMALGLNDRDQAIGVAENSTHDPSCPSPQVLDFEAVTWGPNGQIQALPPLPGDTVGFALAINNSGQIAGSSGSCANTVVTAVGLLAGPHAVMWQNGSVIDLGSLGGTMGKSGAINDRGEVAGFSSVPGDSSVHPFLWTAATGMQDLGPLGTDFLADPAGINNGTQVVGGSCDMSGNCRAFLWDKNVMSDLNDLIPANSPWYLAYALGINDAGEIVGFAVEKSTGNTYAYLASPIPGQAVNATITPTAQERTSESRPATLPENLRTLLRQRLPFGRLGARQVGR